MINDEVAIGQLTSIFNTKSELSPDRCIGKLRHLRRQGEKIYDSKHDGIDDRGFMVTQGYLVLNVYPLADPSAVTTHFLHKGFILFRDVVFHLMRANYGISLKNNLNSSFYDFIDSEFQEKIFKIPKIANYIFTKKIETMSDFLVSKSLSEYYPPKNSTNIIEDNLQYSRLVCELLVGCPKNEKSDWLITDKSPNKLNIITGIKKRTISKYICVLSEQEILNRNSEGIMQINIRKALSLIEGKPYSSLKTAAAIEQLKNNYCYSK